MTNNNTQFEFEIFNHPSFMDMVNRIGFLWELSQHNNIYNLEVDFIENGDFGTTYANGVPMTEHDEEDDDLYRVFPANKTDFIEDWFDLGCPKYYVVFSADKDDFKRATLIDAEAGMFEDGEDKKGIMITYRFTDRHIKRKMKKAINECLEKVEDSSWYEMN